MLYIAKVIGYLEILTDNEVKDFVMINFGGYFKSLREKLYSKYREEQNLRKIAEKRLKLLKISF